MTATDELRRMLDERGVEDTDRDMFGKHVLHWGAPMVNGAMLTDAGEWTELVVENATPEQAIAATLGRGECHDESGGDPCVFVCSCCGTAYDHPEDQLINYCPNCGRRVS